MEALGVVVSRPIASVSGGTRVEPQPHDASLSGFFCSAAVGTKLNLRASRKSLKFARLSSFLFSDKSYLDYYSSGRKIRCGVCKEKVKEEKGTKRRLKMLKSLSRDLAMFSEMGSDQNNALVDPIRAKVVSEAVELLQGQLRQLWAEEEELKQRRKEEKSRLKAAQMLERAMSSSSSSLESSDSDCGQVVDIDTLTCNPLAKQVPDVSQPFPENEMSALPRTCIQQGGTSNILQEAESTEIQEGNLAMERGIKICCNSGSPEQGWSSGISNSSRDGASFSGHKTPAAKKIEVCVGGKCKKSGATVLLEEFQRVIGIEGAVSGCKCMGKCRDGPNVRIANNFDEDMQPVVAQDRIKPAANHLCIGVGLEDVNMIVDNFLGAASQEKIVLPAPS